ncbi:hypothetical protein K493DRAFT_319693, partial [Basidiobolus meristosporus CBS 931.73]
MRHPVDPYLSWCIFEFILLEGVHVRMEINSNGYTISRAAVTDFKNPCAASHHELVIKPMLLEYHGSLASIMAKASQLYTRSLDSAKPTKCTYSFECCR